MRILLIGEAHEACPITARALVARGHEVAALVEAGREEGPFRELRVDIAAGSIFRLADLEAALGKRDVAILFGSHLGSLSLQSQGEEERAALDRFRREGTRSVVAALLRQRVPLFIVVSGVAVYGNTGERLVDERSPANPHRAAQSFLDMEDIANQASEFQGLRRIIVRSALAYTAHDWRTRSLFALLESGQAPPVGGERSYVSLIHANDLAEAIAAAVDRAPAGAVINVVDDEPMRLGELVAEIARAIGVRPPGALPGFLMRLLAGRAAYELLQVSCRASNARAKEMLGWKPQFPSVREQIAEEVAIWRRSYRQAGTEGGRGDATKERP